MGKNKLWMILLIIFLASCASPRASTLQSAPQTPVLMATNSPTIIPTPTIAFTPTPTLTATSEIRLTRQCLPVEDREVELNKVSSGGRILVSWKGPSVEYYESMNTLIDIQTGKEYQLPSNPNSKNSVFISSEASPDRKMYAKLEVLFQENKPIKNAVWVFDARANLVTKLTFNRTDLVWLHWLDNERLMIDTEKYGALVLVNPFTGEQQTLADDLPNLYPYELNKKNFPWWPVVYNPDLKRVAYYSQTIDSDGYPHSGAVLYDLVSKQILWKDADGDSPNWSPDGEIFTLKSEQQLYLFSRPGQVKAILDKSLPHQAGAFSWSPDGRYIAFWNAESLMIYDRQMDWVFDTCISSFDEYISPLWSPDSQQMIVYGSGYSPATILVDWQNKLAYKIKELPHGGRIDGWMNSIP